ncbi:MAG: hypothetical protein WKF59_04830 [Chitinophagaceae bacterium]
MAFAFATSQTPEPLYAILHFKTPHNEISSTINISACALSQQQNKCTIQTNDYPNLNSASRFVSSSEKSPKVPSASYEEAFRIHLPDALAARRASRHVFIRVSNAGQSLSASASCIIIWMDRKSTGLSFDPYFDYLRNGFPEKWNCHKRPSFLPLSSNT